MINFTPYVYEAWPKRIVDGDTVDLYIDQGFGDRTTHRIRLLGINTPERGKPGFQEATTRLHDLIFCKRVLLKTIQDKKGGFGRYLGLIYVGPKDTCVNSKMILDGFAEPYRHSIHDGESIDAFCKRLANGLED